MFTVLVAPHSMTNSLMLDQFGCRPSTAESTTLSCGSASKLCFGKIFTSQTSDQKRSGTLTSSTEELLIKSSKAIWRRWSYDDDDYRINRQNKNTVQKHGKEIEKCVRKGYTQTLQQAMKLEREIDSKHKPVSVGENRETLNPQSFATLILEEKKPKSTTEEHESADEVQRKMKALVDLQRVVQTLQTGSKEEKAKATAYVRRVGKHDADSRTTLAMLGVIPPLISMLDEPDATLQTSVLIALFNIAIGNESNKAWIVRAGAVPKMMKLLQTGDMEIQEAVVAVLLSVTALDVNKRYVGASGVIPMLVGLIERGSPQASKDSLRTLYNLSICASNVRAIVEAGAVHCLLCTLDDVELAEKVLAVLSSLASTDEGRKAIAIAKNAYSLLIDVLNWFDAPKCQERAAYILMMISHHSKTQRYAMVKAGITSTLLELALLGTTLAQKRASKILETLREEKQKGGAQSLSAPLVPTSSAGQEIEHHHRGDGTEELKVVNDLVRQSLHYNMQRMIKRANVQSINVSPHRLNSLIENSSSKSLPF